MSEAAFVDTGGFATSRGAPDAADLAFVRARLGLYPNAAIARMLGRSISYIESVTRLPNAAERPRKRRPEKPPVAIRAPAPTEPWRRSIPETARRAIEAVAALRGVDAEDLVEPWKLRGSNALCEVRQEAYYAVRKLTKPDGSPRYSLPQIGAIFGGRDHGTIHHGVAAHQKRVNARRMEKLDRRRGRCSQTSTPPDQRPTTGGARSVTTERLQDCGEGGKAS